ncbi:MAG: hypothetical protein QY326_04925 [Bdellovibrionota bacterium]|nr:MAG: hypothetical protein QY326_04925 [Bdellovibrionota bacterium]
MGTVRSGLRWGVALVAVSFALVTGYSIYHRPTCEVLYNPWTIEAGCQSSMCVRLFILEVGNTGWDAQEDVAVQVNSDWLELAILKPAAAMFGKVPRAMHVDRQEGISIWRLGRLEAGKRIDIRFTLAADTLADLPNWDQILREVQPTCGRAHRGHPEFTTFFRFITALVS